ncbi:hypothetical protein PHYPO_G00241840 [Pangasianodon hypophthalmus]|uniref:Nudix hydrolase domain-containing protein n=1 Tax=Pangasianodon hypophthalmus TaxID=310915 RepID=A0A5N5NFX2_PANHP|nr:hypothetical protein PHYPO_G00241840 [Pangasianodon hypophthalmus]
MDSEVSVMLHCAPAQGFEEHQVQVEISSRFNRRSGPEIEKHIEAVWNGRVTKEPWLFNGAKFRLHSAELSTTPPQTSMNFCTKAQTLNSKPAEEAVNLQQRGRLEVGDPQALLAQPLGVGAVLLTSDGQVVMLRRSQRVAEAAGLLDIPGGHPEPKAVCEGVSEEDISVDLMQGCERAVVAEIFSSVCAEVRDEVNVPLGFLSAPVLMGIALNHTSAGRPSAEFFIRCSLTMEDVKDFYWRGGPEAHESTDIVFLSKSEMLQLDVKSPLWLELCPSAKGAVLLYQLVRPD